MAESKADQTVLIEALEYMADAASWQGDPQHHDAVLFGHETPYELANRVLAEAKSQDA